jgi:hypothetical protein
MIESDKTGSLSDWIIEPVLPLRNLPHKNLSFYAHRPALQTPEQQLAAVVQPPPVGIQLAAWLAVGATMLVTTGTPIAAPIAILFINSLLLTPTPLLCPFDGLFIFSSIKPARLNSSTASHTTSSAAS